MEGFFFEFRMIIKMLWVAVLLSLQTSPTISAKYDLS